jgi:hypothetical protein
LLIVACTRLAASRAPVDVVVIDSIQRPDEN